MAHVRNKQTGETINVLNTSYDGEYLVGRYEFGPRFYDKYGRAVGYVKSVGGVSYLQPIEGWEVVSSKRTPKTKEEQPKREYKPEAEAEIIEETTKEEPKSQPKVELPKQAEVVNAFAALTPLFAGVEANVTANIMAKVQPLLDRVPQTIVHKIVRPDGSVFESTEVFHENFDEVCKRTAAGIWTYLYGPTGSGKNVLAEQVARALGLKFFYQAHTTDRFELTGFVDAAGNYQATEFYHAYTEGGLFMLDELDASDENTLITLNSAANGYFAFPCGTVKQHPDFRLIAAGNTVGRGATDEYTGRRVLDMASLSRFLPREHKYSRIIDMAAAQQDEALVEFVEKLREIKDETGIQILASPRQIKTIKLLEGLGSSLSDLLRDAFATYLTVDDLNIVQNKICGMNNRYAQIFVEL